MRSFYSKHFRIKAVLKKLLREDLKKQKNYELFCSLLAGLSIFCGTYLFSNGIIFAIVYFAEQ